jgi:hypothetical protein
MKKEKEICGSCVNKDFQFRDSIIWPSMPHFQESQGWTDLSLFEDEKWMDSEEMERIHWFRCHFIFLGIEKSLNFWTLKTRDKTSKNLGGNRYFGGTRYWIVTSSVVRWWFSLTNRLVWWINLRSKWAKFYLSLNHTATFLGILTQSRIKSQMQFRILRPKVRNIFLHYSFL